MKNYTDKLVEMVGRGERETPKYKKLCAELDQKREAKKGEYFGRVIETLKQILPVAEQHGPGVGSRAGLDVVQHLHAVEVRRL